jgi:uncharacterized protein
LRRKKGFETMEMQGKRELAVTQQQAWESLNNPEVLKLCIPGCDKIESTGPDRYAIGMALKIGPVSAKFAGNIQLADINPPDSYTLSFDGQGGAAGFGKGSSKVVLTPLPSGGCELNYSVNASVGGKIAQLGQRLIDAASKSMADDFFKRFDVQMQERYPAAVQSYSTYSNEPPPEVAKNAAEGPKPGVPVWVWAVAAVFIGLLAFGLLNR